MKTIKIKFVDFWPSLDHKNNNFTRALESKFHVEVLDVASKETPDILFYSALGNEHYKYEGCIKVYYTGENDVPDFNECDYALSFHHIDFSGRHLRYPLYMTYEIDQALNPPHISDHDAINREFCSLLMSNSTNCSPKRLEIIDAVEAYKAISYGGPYRNNTGGCVPIDGKIDFISHYKFNLALENSAIPGYITEKIVEPFAAPTVPIYWGAPDIGKDFNPDAFINVSDYDSLSSFIADLKNIDNDSNRYLSLLRAPRIASDTGIDFDTQLADFLCNIASSLTPRTEHYARGGNIARDNRLLQRAFNHPFILKILYRLDNVFLKEY